MTNPSLWLIFWTVLIFASVAWYAILLFLVGWKGWKEVLQLIHRLSTPVSTEQDDKKEASGHKDAEG